MRIQNTMFSDAADTRDAQAELTITPERLNRARGAAHFASQLAALTFYQFFKDQGGFKLFLSQTGGGLLFLAAAAGIANREIKKSFYGHMALMIAPAVLLVLFFQFNIAKIRAKKIQTVEKVLLADKAKAKESCMSKSSKVIAFILVSIIPQFIAYAFEPVVFRVTNTTVLDNVKENMELCGLAMAVSMAVSMAVGICFLAAIALCCPGKKAGQDERTPLLPRQGPGL